MLFKVVYCCFEIVRFGVCCSLSWSCSWSTVPCLLTCLLSSYDDSRVCKTLCGCLCCPIRLCSNSGRPCSDVSSHLSYVRCIVEMYTMIACSCAMMLILHDANCACTRLLEGLILLFEPCELCLLLVRGSSISYSVIIRMMFNCPNLTGVLTIVPLCPVCSYVFDWSFTTIFYLLEQSYSSLFSPVLCQMSSVRCAVEGVRC